MDQFILFGDSITQQAFTDEGIPFGAKLSDAYIRKLDIINRGLSGYNTTQALRILPQLMPTPSQATVRLIWIFFGANDARLPDTPGGPQQHVPIATFYRNLEAMGTHPCVLAHEGVRVILVTPPPIDEGMLEKADGDKYGARTLRRWAETTASYARVVLDLGRALNLPVLNLWDAMVRHTGDFSLQEFDITRLPPGSKAKVPDARLRSYLRDGLHLSRAGYEVLYREFMALIERTWPDQMPERLGFTFPAWDDEEAWKVGSGEEGAKI